MKRKLFSFCILISFLMFSCASFIDQTYNSPAFRQSNNIHNDTNSSGSSHNVTNQMPDTSQNRRAVQDTANWDIASLDTAANADYLSGVEKDIILEMNKVRTNPGKYAELYIQPRLRYFNGNNYSVPGQITILTREGASAVNICVAALKRTNSAGILYPELGLSLAAKDHVTDQGRTGQTGHNGSDRSSPQVRMERYGKFGRSYTYGENIAYGSNTAREIVVQLLIDDGVPSRGHRINIMNDAFKQTGVSIGNHSQYRTTCTIKYANGYTSNQL